MAENENVTEEVANAPEQPGKIKIKKPKFCCKEIRGLSK